jgi:hypothetical protein
MMAARDGEFVTVGHSLTFSVVNDDSQNALSDGGVVRKDESTITAQCGVNSFDKFYYAVYENAWLWHFRMDGL